MLRSLLGSRFWITSYIALLAGFLLPAGWAPAEAMRSTVPVFLGGILFFSSLRLPLADLRLAMGDRRLLAQTAALTPVKLLLIPLLAWALATLLTPAWAPGVLLVSLMPAGLTSIAFADLYRGDRAMALFLVVATSLVAPATVPLVMALAGHGGQGFPLLPLLERAGYILLLLVVPFSLGQVVRRAAPAFTARHHAAFSAWAILCSCTLVFCSVASTRASWDHLPWIDLLPGLLGACLGSLAAAAGAWLVLTTLRRERATAFAMGAIYMNNGLSVAFALRFFPDDPHIVLPCILMQVPMSGVTAIAGWWLMRR
jgi:BASS family bile acid:Na+ symporter